MPLDDVALVGVGDTGIRIEAWLRQSGLGFGLLGDVAAADVSSALRVAIVVADGDDSESVDEVRALEARLALHAVVPVWIMLGKAPLLADQVVVVRSLSELAAAVRTLHRLAREKDVVSGSCSLLDLVADTAMSRGDLEVITIDALTPGQCVTEFLHRLRGRSVHRLFVLASFADDVGVPPDLHWPGDHPALVRFDRSPHWDRGPWLSAFVQTERASTASTRPGDHLQLPLTSERRRRA
ncbi:MAG: hypothetical protein HYS27_23050 [Deltaproteobacteria bacterium]|nr:hypothetical protein [Deltaproteobacteria bacterium]